MLRRHDNLSRMLLTVATALVFGLLVEARGLHVWAERLEVGPIRESILPIAEHWEAWVKPYGVAAPRQAALETKEELSARLAQPHLAMFGGARPETQADTLRHSAATAAMQSPPDTSSPPGDFGAELPAPAAPGTVSTQEQATPPPLPEAALPDFSIPLASAVPEEGGISPPVVSVAAPAAVAIPDNAAPATSDTATAPLPARAETLEIALAGDSMMAVGLAPTLTRGLAGEKNIRFVKAYRSGTGLARPEVFDWLREYPQMLGDTQPTVVICALGANDGQNVKVGKEVLEFGSEKWDAFYRERLISYLDMLSRRKAHVLWIGMPAMREPRFARKMHHMNDLVKGVSGRYPNVTWLDPNPDLGYRNNTFAQYSTMPSGKPVKLRADDGIHMTDQGANFLFPSIRRWLAQTAVVNPPAFTPTRTGDARSAAIDTPRAVEGSLNRTM